MLLHLHVPYLIVRLLAEPLGAFIDSQHAPTDIDFIDAYSLSYHFRVPLSFMGEKRLSRENKLLSPFH
jgi:hypothetical protein